jgi:hypothetical protein
VVLGANAAKCSAASRAFRDHPHPDWHHVFLLRKMIASGEDRVRGKALLLPLRSCARVEGGMLAAFFYERPLLGFGAFPYQVTRISSADKCLGQVINCCCLTSMTICENCSNDLIWKGDHTQRRGPRGVGGCTGCRAVGGTGPTSPVQPPFNGALKSPACFLRVSAWLTCNPAAASPLAIATPTASPFLFFLAAVEE